MCLLTTSMFMTNMLLWWKLDSVLLPLLIKPNVLKEVLQWRFERQAQVESYVVTSIKPNKRFQLTMQHSLLLLNATFVSRTRPLTTERGIRGQVPQVFLCPSQILLRPVCRKHITKTKILSPKNVLSPPNLKTILRACEERPTWRKLLT